MIISKVIDFRSFYKNLEKIRKIDHGQGLGIVYDSILPFEQFLSGMKFPSDLEIFRVGKAGWEDWDTARQRPPSWNGSWRSPQTWLKNEKINFHAKEQL
jgi:hypothetical protein